MIFKKNKSDIYNSYENPYIVDGIEIFINNTSEQTWEFRAKRESDGEWINDSIRIEGNQIISGHSTSWDDVNKAFTYVIRKLVDRIKQDMIKCSIERQNLESANRFIDNLPDSLT